MSDPFPPTRAEALARLHTFVPKAGRDYAENRNFDRPDRGHPHVSQLSPYLRHRLVTEPEVCAAVLDRHSFEAAEKFIQEVCWRSYWKGWLEMRPGIWADYMNDVHALQENSDVENAQSGRTPIAAFNDWATELVDTGYLHNHARMWFASIWIFTLKLPWQAGADFFLRHLIDGDPASNTLSWRWVAGLQTRGKHYLAHPSNIGKFTDGRHSPEGQLTENAAPLSGTPHPDPRPLLELGEIQPGLRTGLLLHEDDLSPDFVLDALSGPPVGTACLLSHVRRSPGPVSANVMRFTEQAAEDALTGLKDRLGEIGPVTSSDGDIAAWASGSRIEQVVAPYAPVGPAGSAMRALRKSLQAEGITLVERRRDWDNAAWPHATHGFFRFRKIIPDLLTDFTGRWG
ncbi:DNA photolyase [Rhodobacterales bacterium HKCCE4037]|nr:DNA photolyase [Rhodobacterales bacterium HKCCE4037]